MSYKSCRLKSGLTQAVAATKIGVHQTAVAQWENGRACPKADKLKEIADVYNCTVDELLEPDAAAAALTESLTERRKYADNQQSTAIG